MENVSGIERLGRFLFRWRGPIGFLGFVVVFWLARASVLTCLAGLPFVLAGCGLRLWAMGYVGGDARAGRVGGERYVGGGPYRWFRLSRRSPAGHPLYFGNFLLVVGFLVVLRPPVLLSLLVVAVFLLEYLLIARAEERYLARKFKGVASAAHVAFRFRNAVPEWRTLAVVLIAYGLAVARVLLRTG